MKNIFLILTVTIFGVFLMSSCSNSLDDKFIGEWKSERGLRIEITKEGEVYIFKSNDAFVQGPHTFRYSDGRLKRSWEGYPILGDITYGEENNHIYFDGMEYAKTK